LSVVDCNEQQTIDKLNLSLPSEVLVLFMMAGEFIIDFPQAAKVNVVASVGKLAPLL
jgi:hypothetical protein